MALNILRQAMNYSTLKVLFIGGTGVISSACSQLCCEEGIDLFVLNRGTHNDRMPKSCKHLPTDISDVDRVKSLIAQLRFEVIVDWIAYTPADLVRDFELFRSKTDQYIFISSASAYQKPPSRFPYTENEPLSNPFWAYSQNKILCEKKLMELFDEHQFPVTIVRPSHTYDKTKIPLPGAYTTMDRMLKNKQVIIHGDGTSLWTLTHHKDFAKGFLGLLGRSEAIGEAYHITSDEVLSWNQICRMLGSALGVEPRIVHIPSEFIHRFDRDWGDGLLGDKAHSMVFDNSKIKKINPAYRAEIPFSDGSKEIAQWYLADCSRQQVDAQLNNRMDMIIARYESAF